MSSPEEAHGMSGQVSNSVLRACEIQNSIVKLLVSVNALFMRIVGLVLERLTAHAFDDQFPYWCIDDVWSVNLSVCH